VSFQLSQVPENYTQYLKIFNQMIFDFLKHSSLYSLSSVITKVIAFLLLSVYARVFSKEEFGAFDYFLSIGGVISIILTIDITQGVMRYIPEVKGELSALKGYISSSLVFIVVSYLTVFIFLVIWLDEIESNVFDSSFDKNIILSFYILFFLTALFNFFNVVLRAQLRVKSSAILLVVQATLSAFFSLLFILVLDFGLLGLVIGLSLSTLLMIVYFLVDLRNLIFSRPNFSYFVQLAKYSLPLVPSSLAIMLTMVVDRFMIEEMIGLEAVASYGIAARIASVVFIVTVGVQSALTPLIYANHTSDNTPSAVARLFNIYLIISIVVIIFLYFSSNQLVGLIGGSMYEESALLVPILAAATLSSSMYIFFPGLSIAKKTILIATISITVVIFNVIMNLYLIPHYGIYGASIASLFSVLIGWVLYVLLSYQFYKIPFSKSLALLYFVFLMVVI
jgi:O-antigen/teichoic acid export membrane protein